MIPFELSSLGHTWFIDIDGTIFKHEGLWQDGHDSLLPGVRELWASIPDTDIIVITTARESWFEKDTIAALERFNLRYDHIIFNLPVGERIVINDVKESGLKTAIAWNLKRDQGFLKTK